MGFRVQGFRVGGLQGLEGLGFRDLGSQGLGHEGSGAPESGVLAVLKRAANIFKTLRPCYFILRGSRCERFLGALYECRDLTRNIPKPSTLKIKVSRIHTKALSPKAP